MNEAELQKILEKHMKWLRGEGGERANLRNANLSGANLCNANLSGADLSYAYLRDTYLRDADLSYADLSDADLSNADLSNANLSYADLSDADLCYVKNAMSAAFFPLQCPETGTYTAYKKAGGFIVRLEIPADARRSSATSRKCRADKAKVISITKLDETDAGITEVASDYDADFIYTVGQTVTVDDFDTDRWKECAPGIHHFITIQEAVDYEP